MANMNLGRSNNVAPPEAPVVELEALSVAKSTVPFSVCYSFMLPVMIECALMSRAC